MLAGAALAATMLGCSKSEEEASGEEKILVARVDDWTLSANTLEEVIKTLPERQRAKWETPAGRAELTDRFITEELFFREAEREGLPDNPRVQEQLDDARRRILIAAYHREFVEKEAAPDEQEIRDYYEANKDQFTSLPVYRAQHIFSKNDPEMLLELKERIIEGGENFTTMAHRYSQDEATRDAGGDLGYFNAGGYIGGIGFSQMLSDSISALEPGEVYGPVKWERGYSLLKLNSRGGGELKTLDEVREEIVRALIDQRVEHAKYAIIGRVAGNYDSHNYLRERMALAQRSAEELFNFAQSTSNSDERIGYFREIVDRYPDDQYAPQALFMIGFVYSEELEEYNHARQAFHELLDRYPDSEVAETAQWMLENLGSNLPEFESIDELNKQVKEQSN
jgi:peptidyl-prolyl cis-trans isomerase C